MNELGRRKYHLLRRRNLLTFFVGRFECPWWKVGEKTRRRVTVIKGGGRERARGKKGDGTRVVG